MSDTEYENDFDDEASASAPSAPTSPKSESSLQGYTPIATLDHDGGEDRDGGQEQQQHPRYAFPLSDTGGMANMRTIEDLQDILCELPADFKGKRQAFSPRPPEEDRREKSPPHERFDGGLNPVILSSDVPRGARLLERPGSGMSGASSSYKELGRKNHLVEEGYSKQKKSSSLDPAVLDEYVLRLILNSALLDMPPKNNHQSTVFPAPSSPVPHVRPYWQQAMTAPSIPLPSYVDTARCYFSPTKAASVNTSSPFGRRRAFGSPIKQEQQQGERKVKGGRAVESSSSPYVDTARFERAKILALAQNLNEVETIEERIRRRRANSPPQAIRRRALRALEATSEESALFQEQYARFVNRLSYLSQQDHVDDLHGGDLALDHESERQRRKGVSMAVALSESIREVMADPVVIDLIKEATITRMKERERKEKATN